MARAVLFRLGMMQNGALSNGLAILGLVAASALAGCAGEASSRRTPTFQSEAPYLESDIPPAGVPTPRAEVSDVDGLDTAQAGKKFSAAAQALKNCPRFEKTPVRVRVERKDDHTRIDFVDAPPASLGADGRRCVLDAMSTVEVDDVASGASPSNKPSGFTANVLLSWW